MICCHRNALKIDKDTVGTCWTNPGICVPCDLHTKNRVVEKLVQQILLAGMRRLQPGKLDAHINQAENIVNGAILNRLILYMEDNFGRWTFPLDDTKKKVKGISFSNPVTT